MKKTFKKILCTMLVVVMCLTSAPLQGFVGMEWPDFSEWFSNKASAANELAATGQCGDNVYWSYNSEDKELIISGEGTIWDYSYDDNSPFNWIDIKSVVVCEGITSIGNHLFVHCEELTSIILPDSLIRIGEFSFIYCRKLINVELPHRLTTIGDCAFNSCNNLSTIYIPKSINSIGFNAFGSCLGLQAIVVADNNYYFSSDNFGALYNKDKTVLLQYPVGNERKSFTVPDSVTNIESIAFMECENLINVTIPNSVITIGDEAFLNCSSLINITIPNSVVTIGDSVFAECTSLMNVTISDSIIIIGDSAFYNCRNLTSITLGTGISNIGIGVFDFCFSLTDVYYKGSEEEWNNIIFGKYNDELFSATIHFLDEDKPNFPDEPELDGYRLRLRSDGAYSDSIAVGETISFWTFLSNNGKSVNCERAYAISFDNPGIFDVVKTKITEPSFDITLFAKKAGTTNMTISDSVTGAYVTIRLKANNPVDVLTMDDVKKLATEEYGGITTYFYNINGLYINNYSYSENKDGTYNVKMTAYNEKAHYGAVVSYDKNGNIHKFKVINPKDKLPENLWDGLYDSFDYVNYKLDDWFGDTNYTDIGWTQRTPITIEVPEGGYFEITNKYFNEIVFMTNVIDLTIDLAFAVNDLPEIGIKGATVETVKQLFIKIGSKGIEKLCKKIFKEYSKGIGFENIYDVIFDVAELTKEYDVDFFKIITENINYEELIMDSVESAVLSVIAKPVKEVLDGFGYINTLIKCGDFFNSSLASEVVVYTPAEEPYKRESSGVKVTSETPLDPDYVLHSYIINEADDVMADAKPTIEALASNYTMYDITLYKSGAAVQPNAKIKVMIPIPADYNKNNIQIYWYKEDGTLQSMNAVVQGDYAVFETDHLSYYVLIDHSHSDENHDGICDTCGYDATENCDCRCHNDGFFAKIIWKIINFFNKFLRRNQECECGFYHY